MTRVLRHHTHPSPHTHLQIQSVPCTTFYFSTTSPFLAYSLCFCRSFSLLFEVVIVWVRCSNSFRAPPLCVDGEAEASVCTSMHICNFTRTNIGRREENWQIEQVQRVWQFSRMTMMQSLTFQAHYAEAFTHMVVRFDRVVVFGDTHPNAMYIYIYICVYTCVQYSHRWWCDLI